MSEIDKVIMDTRAYSCLDCGKCTAACPVSKYDNTYSPRKVVSNMMREHGVKLLRDSQLWSCITCAMCEERCQSGVQYTELIKSLRGEARTIGENGQCTHGGALQSLMHLMTADYLSQDRLTWLDSSLKAAVKSDVLYFTGCLPYFDILFKDIGVRTIDTAKGAVKLLNSLGIVPAVLPNERCCGHDLLWTGDTEHFAKLVEHNVEELSRSGVKTVVTTCAECYQTLKVQYPRYAGTLDFEVVHISQLLAKGVADGKLNFRRSARKVTYHDPCKLGRFSGIYDEPRELIESIRGVELMEMGRNRNSALCCGTQAWINCGTVNKQIQVERLREAHSTGAEVLITSCPKCQIHLKCALHDGRLEEELGIEIMDITSLAARALSG
ncbi:(Fe-S)-binding protein [Chloroflexota bacterium]